MTIISQDQQNRIADAFLKNRSSVTPLGVQKLLWTRGSKFTNDDLLRLTDFDSVQRVEYLRAQPVWIPVDVERILALVSVSDRQSMRVVLAGPHQKVAVQSGTTIGICHMVGASFLIGAYAVLPSGYVAPVAGPGLAP